MKSIPHQKGAAAVASLLPAFAVCMLVMLATAVRAQQDPTPAEPRQGPQHPARISTVKPIAATVNTPDTPNMMHPLAPGAPTSPPAPPANTPPSGQGAKAALPLPSTAYYGVVPSNVATLPVKTSATPTPNWQTQPAHPDTSAAQQPVVSQAQVAAQRRQHALQTNPALQPKPTPTVIKIPFELPGNNPINSNPCGLWGCGQPPAGSSSGGATQPCNINKPGDPGVPCFCNTFGSPPGCTKAH